MSIPSAIANPERLVRIIYKEKIKPNDFRPKPNTDEVSILRLEYTIPDFCKKHGKENEKPEDKRIYHGLAVIRAEEVRKVGADVVSAPLQNLEMHGNIKIGCIAIPHEQLPQPYNFMTQRMAQAARFYKDPSPEKEKWESDKNLK
ncbi:MAG TPA: hypothetical protein VI757_12905 [Bacteroidia bacterium]|nr:hypothetical protein [Bacteroidia bacterium]